MVLFCPVNDISMGYTRLMIGNELFENNVNISGDTDWNQITLEVPAQAGVCLFTGEEDLPIQLLFGANLRRIVRSRLRAGEDNKKSRRAQLRSIVKKVWFRRGYSAFEIQLAYFRIARTIYPDTYQNLFTRLDVWFIQIDPNDSYPVFNKIVNRIDRPGLYWGPFADGKSTQRFLEILQNAFRLCRCPEILSQAPHAIPCAYAQMNRCAAACDGSMSSERYRATIKEAIDLLNRPRPMIEKMREQMMVFSAKQQFEQAQALKEKVAEVKKLLVPAYRWVFPLERFRVFCFQSGPPLHVPGQPKAQSSVSPFVIGPGWVYQIEPFVLSDSEQVTQSCRCLFDHLNIALMRDKSNLHFPKGQELFAWVAQRLFRNDRDKGLFIPVEDTFDSQELSQKVIEHFTQPKKQTRQRLHLDTYHLTDPELSSKPEPPETPNA